MDNQELARAIYDVKERVVRIETKLDQYNAVRETAYKAKEMAEDNAEKIIELKESQKWATRTGFSSLIGVCLKVLYDAFMGK